MPQSNVRVVGSGFTTFNYKGVPLAWCDSVQDSGQDPFGEGGGAKAIYVLGAKHPVEIVTTRVLSEGYLTLSFKELWNAAVWESLAGLEGTKDIVEVYERFANEPSEVTCQMLIVPPNGAPPRGKTFHNCVLVAIADGDTITVAGMDVSKSIRIGYTHSTPI